LNKKEKKTVTIILAQEKHQSIKKLSDIFNKTAISLRLHNFCTVLCNSYCVIVMLFNVIYYTGTFVMDFYLKQKSRAVSRRSRDVAKTQDS